MVGIWIDRYLRLPLTINRVGGRRSLRFRQRRTIAASRGGRVRSCLHTTEFIMAGSGKLLSAHSSVCGWRWRISDWLLEAGLIFRSDRTRLTAATNKTDANPRRSTARTTAIMSFFSVGLLAHVSN